MHLRIAVVVHVISTHACKIVEYVCGLCDNGILEVVVKRVERGKKTGELCDVSQVTT